MNADASGQGASVVTRQRSWSVERSRTHIAETSQPRLSDMTRTMRVAALGRSLASASTRLIVDRAAIRALLGDAR